ncbi:MAG: anaerobic ribonucleoside-triphosphate reductase activating protein [Clostridia bacterium]|nr:anaerobic ribonucleoside-triphosphate reductase activating protein [Clostridia bacterium]
MNYATIKKNDVANGPGVRVSLFVSGCRHYCRDCFNSEAWDFAYGKEFTDDTVKEILDACDHSYIEGLSILGGEPFEPENQAGLLKLIKAFRERYPEKNVWCYTGFLFDRELLGGSSRASTPIVGELVRSLDFLVDGRFEADKRDLTLRFRGSSNQRIIDIKRTKDINAPVLWDDSTDIIKFDGE